MINEPGIYDLGEEEYHADPVPEGSLSSSGSKLLLRSPALYQYRLEHPEHKDTFDAGHIVHTLVLGTGSEIKVLDHDSYRTKAAQEERDDARAAGLVPILRDKYQPLKDTAEAVLAEPLARALLEREGQQEVSLFAQDEETGVWLRGRIDHLPSPVQRRTIGVDLKTSADANPREFANGAARYGYDVQAEWYRHLITATRGDEDPAFVFIVVEKEPPHLVSVIELDRDFRDLGKRRMRRAINLYHQCRESGRWPGYASAVAHIGPPKWHEIQTDLMETAS